MGRLLMILTCVLVEWFLPVPDETTGMWIVAADLDGEALKSGECER